MLARTTIFEVAFVLIFIHEFDLPHVIQPTITECSCLSDSIFSYSRLIAVPSCIFIDAVAIRLIINELRYQCTLVLKYHFTLSNSFVIHEFSLIYISVSKVVGSSAISFVVFEVSFIEFTILILKYNEIKFNLPRS
jgi:hypothetical protein